VLLLVAGLPVTPAAAAGVEVFIKRAELEAILVTGAPYHLDLDLFLGTQTLSFERPRDLTMNNGRLRFRVTCSGSPVPIRAELQPEIAITRNPDNGDFEIQFSSLPLKFPGVGAIDIKNYIPPQKVSALIHHVIRGDDRNRIGMIRFHDIRIEPEGIAVEFDFRFLPDGEDPSR
jgi:hypothetical protein